MPVRRNLKAGLGRVSKGDAYKGGSHRQRTFFLLFTISVSSTNKSINLSSFSTLCMSQRPRVLACMVPEIL